MSPPHLANAELAVMELLWKQDGLTARHIREQLYPDATRAQHGTVQRLLQRLEDKESAKDIDRRRGGDLEAVGRRIRAAVAAGEMTPEQGRAKMEAYVKNLRERHAEHRVR